jgi:hypothetical protein
MDEGYRGTYRRSKSFRTYLDGSPQAIPGISSSSRRTRSTAHHTCQHILHTSTPAISGLSRLPSQEPRIRLGGRCWGMLEGCWGVSIPQVAACRLSIRQFMYSRQGKRARDVPPQYTICLACGSSGAVSVSAIAGCCDGSCGSLGGWWWLLFSLWRGCGWRGSCARVALGSQLEGCWCFWWGGGAGRR